MIAKLKQYAKAAVAGALASLAANAALITGGNWDIKSFLAAEAVAALTAVGVAVTSNAAPA